MKAWDVLTLICGIILALVALFFIAGAVYHTANQNEFLLTVQEGGVPFKIIKTN